MENDQPHTPRPSRRNVLAATAGAVVGAGLGSALTAPGAAAARPAADRTAAMLHEATRLNEIDEINLWQAPPARRAPGLLTTKQFAADRDRDVLFTDKAVGHRFCTDRSELPPLAPELESFGKWPDVASTVYNKLLQITGFNPTDIDFDSACHASFKSKFATCPFWNGIEFNITYRDVKLYKTDYRMATAAVDDLVAIGTTPEARSNILSSLKQCATLADANAGNQVKQTLFQNSTLCITNGRLYVFLLYGFVQLSAQNHHKHVVIDEDLRVVRGYGVLNVDLCNRHADSIVRYDKKNVEEWEKETCSCDLPENPSPGWP